MTDGCIYNRDEAHNRRERVGEEFIQQEEGGEMSVSLTRGAVIFTLYQCCADLCGGEQTDRDTAAARHGSHPGDI